MLARRIDLDTELRKGKSPLPVLLSSLSPNSLSTPWELLQLGAFYSSSFVTILYDYFPCHMYSTPSKSATNHDHFLIRSQYHLVQVLLWHNTLPQNSVLFSLLILRVSWVVFPLPVVCAEVTHAAVFSSLAGGAYTRPQISDTWCSFTPVV